MQHHVYKNTKFILCSVISPGHGTCFWGVVKLSVSFKCKKLLFPLWCGIHYRSVLGDSGKYYQNKWKNLFLSWNIYFMLYAAPVIWQYQLVCIFKVIVDEWTKQIVRLFTPCWGTSSWCSRMQRTSIGHLNQGALETNFY